MTALVGPSGSGKTTLGMFLVTTLPAPIVTLSPNLTLFTSIHNWHKNFHQLRYYNHNHN